MEAQPQVTTIFSINSDTNEPYISVEHATKLIKFHISRHGKNVLNSRLHSMEDLTQAILLSLCQYKYDSTLSAPKTFIILVAKSYLGRISTYNKTNKKNLEVSDFVVMGTDGQPSLISESCGPIENINPEEVLLAKELLEEFHSNPELTAKGTIRVIPSSYQQRGPKPKKP